MPLLALSHYLGSGRSNDMLEGALGVKGMSTYWERWDNEGQAWREIYSMIDPVLAAFAEESGCRLTRYHGDAPDRLLSWESNGIRRNIHVFLEGEAQHYQLVVEVNASIDEIHGRKTVRHWDHTKIDQLPAIKGAEDASDYRRRVYELLKKAHSIVSGWATDDLKRTSTFLSARA